MRLSKVKITNHSRIQDLNLEVRRHAVIVGANDVGKSSILRMLNLVLGTSTAGLYQALKPADLRDPEQPLVIDVLWSDFSEVSRRPFPSEISISQDQTTEYLWGADGGPAGPRRRRGSFGPKMVPGERS